MTKHPKGWQSGGRDSLCGHVTKDEEKEKELDEAAKKFERTLGSNKPPKEK